MNKKMKAKAASTGISVDVLTDTITAGVVKNGTNWMLCLAMISMQYKKDGQASLIVENVSMHFDKGEEITQIIEPLTINIQMIDNNSLKVEVTAVKVAIQ